MKVVVVVQPAHLDKGMVLGHPVGDAAADVLVVRVLVHHHLPAKRETASAPPRAAIRSYRGRLARPQRSTGPSVLALAPP